MGFGLKDAGKVFGHCWENFKLHLGKKKFNGWVHCYKGLTGIQNTGLVDDIWHRFITLEISVVECRVSKAGLTVDKLITMKTKTDNRFQDGCKAVFDVHS